MTFFGVDLFVSIFLEIFDIFGRFSIFWFCFLDFFQLFLLQFSEKSLFLGLFNFSELSTGFTNASYLYLWFIFTLILNLQKNRIRNIYQPICHQDRILLLRYPSFWWEELTVYKIERWFVMRSFFCVPKINLIFYFSPKKQLIDVNKYFFVVMWSIFFQKHQNWTREVFYSQQLCLCLLPYKHHKEVFLISFFLIQLTHIWFF